MNRLAKTRSLEPRVVLGRSVGGVDGTRGRVAESLRRVEADELLALDDLGSESGHGVGRQSVANPMGGAAGRLVGSRLVLADCTCHMGVNGIYGFHGMIGDESGCRRNDALDLLRAALDLGDQCCGTVPAANRGMHRTFP